MSNFDDFKSKISEQFSLISSTNLFVTNVSKDDLWENYLSSFPEGTNPIYKERTEHDCQYCKQFIRTCGNVVCIENNRLVSIWDIEVGGFYQAVADHMAALVKSKAISNFFLHYEKNLGVDFNHDTTEDGEVIKWTHLFFKLPSRFVKPSDHIGAILSDAKSSIQVFSRGLQEITMDALDIVLELIDQNSIYRGSENRPAVEEFRKWKKKFIELDDEVSQDCFCWSKVSLLQSILRLRNTAIGTLLVDISNNIDLTQAVKLFEVKVAPTNYKRPTALITKSMIKNAQDTAVELGIVPSLDRRPAEADDITINNVLWADRTVAPLMSGGNALGVFDQLLSETSENVSSFSKVEEVDIDTFLESLLPKATSVELFVENRHTNNFMSLVAPKYEDSPLIFKWENNFSWAYNGGVTDSVKERVRKAGGNVDGVLRCSLSWFNKDDLDIHVIEPDGNRISYSNRRSSVTKGYLDVDMNIRERDAVQDAVENIAWLDESRLLEGDYVVEIHNYTPREMVNVGFEVEIEYNSSVTTFSYDSPVKTPIQIARFNYSKAHGVQVKDNNFSSARSKPVYGIPTQSFNKVNMVILSPNYWDNQNSNGNKHFFFILENCKAEDSVRGFFNEFLRNDLMKHRKVFEVLGSRMCVEPTDKQLSGIGFSSTKHDSVICKLTGSFTRTIKIKF